eukprot:481030-Pyramimonas_sp.AAC.2
MASSTSAMRLWLLRGVAQGCPRSPGACDVVCCYLEVDSARPPKGIDLHAVHRASALRSRWVDDNNGVHCFRLPPHNAVDYASGPPKRRWICKSLRGGS